MLNNRPIRVLKPIFILLLIIGGSCFAPSAIGRERDWQPQRTWVFIVGLLKWQHRDMFDSFPQTNRRDAQLVDYFRQQGVPEEQIVFLRDAQATTHRVRNSFPAFLSKARPGDLLFFYYTGHGYKSDDERTTYFATYDAGADVEGWATESIVRDVERNFRGSRALLTADTCYSGSLAAQTKSLGSRVSYASLTSASSNQLSTQNWTFTEMLLNGLRGKSFADLNGDGDVTLSELAEDIKGDMAFAENQRATFVTTPSFPKEMVLASATRKIDPLISRRVEVRSEGDWYKARVIDARGSSYQVHFFGYEDSEDEWVTLRQIRSAGVTESAANRGDGWETTQNPSRVDQGRRDNGRWDGSAAPERIRRPSWNDEPSSESRPARNPPRNLKPVRAQPSWNN